jgi:ABC-type glycerol-3-phosphate transport system substrate-binding protein
MRADMQRGDGRTGGLGMGMVWWRGCGLAMLVLVAAAGARAQEAPTAAPFAFSIGLPTTAQARLPLEEYQPADPALKAILSPWSRNILKAIDTPLPLTREVLPPLLVVQAGEYAEDIRLLAERRLLEPVAGVMAELGQQPEDYSPALLAAFSNQGVLYALPLHVTVPVIRYSRAAFAGAAPPPPASWEELLALGAPLVAGRGTPGPRRVLSIPMSAARFAALVAMACGEPPLDVANPVFLNSARFAAALRWVRDGIAQGQIDRRQSSTPMTLATGAVFGVDHIESFHADAPFGMLAMPSRLHAQDTPPERRYVPGRAEGVSVRSISPQHRTASIALLKWLFSPETAWRMFERTHARTPSDKWLLDNVHVPLRAQTLQTLDFEYAMKKFPELELLRAQQSEATFAQIPAPLEDLVWERVEATVDYLPVDADLAAELQALFGDVQEIVRTTPVESVAYAGY